METNRALLTEQTTGIQHQFTTTAMAASWLYSRYELRETLLGAGATTDDVKKNIEIIGCTLFEVAAIITAYDALVAG